MSRLWKRSILIGLAVPNLLTGIWAVLCPAGWYEDFPGWTPRLVSALPPYNEHLAADAGAGFLATGLVVLLAGAWLRREATIVATIGYLAFALPHATFHLRRPADGLTTAQNAWNSGSLWLTVALAATVLAAELRSGRSG